MKSFIVEVVTVTKVKLDDENIGAATARAIQFANSLTWNSDHEGIIITDGDCFVTRVEERKPYALVVKE